jgi:hypothetical protein
MINDNMRNSSFMSTSNSLSFDIVKRLSFIRYLNTVLHGYILFNLNQCYQFRFSYSMTALNYFYK